MEKENKKTDEKVELTAVTTQTANMFKLPNGEIVGYEEYLVWLGNQVYLTNKKIQ